MSGTKQLFIDLIGRDKGASAAVEHLGNKATKSGTDVEGFGAKAGTAMLGVGAAAAGLALKSANTFSEVGLEVLKLQRYTGGSAEEMSKLRFAAKQMGVDVDSVTKGLGIFSKKLEASKDPMKDFGVETHDSSGKLLPMNDILGNVAERFSKMPNGVEKTALAMKTFGRSGADLIPLLNQGKAGMAELSKKAEEMGVVIGQDVVDKMLANKRAQRDLTASLEGLQLKIGGAVLPVLTSLTNALGKIPGPVMNIAAPVVGAGVALLSVAAAASKISTVVGPAIAGLKKMNDTIKASGGGAGASMAKMGAYAAGIGLVLAATEKMKSDSDEVSTRLFKGIDFTNLDAANAKLNQTGQTINDMGTKWNNYSAAEKIRNAGEFKNQRDAAAQQVEYRKHLDQSVAAINQLGGALGITGKEAQKMAAELKIDPASVPYPVLEETMRLYREGTITTAEAQKRLGEATKGTTEEQRSQANEMKAAIDPLFAMTNAMQKNMDAQVAARKASHDLAQAQKEYDYAVLTTLPGSAQQTKALDKLTKAQHANDAANMGAVKSALDVTVATEKLTKAVAAGTTSVDAATITLNGWVSQGLITQAQADTTAAKFGKVAHAANVLDGKRVDMSVDVDTSRALASLKALYDTAPTPQYGPFTATYQPPKHAEGAYYPARSGGSMAVVGEAGQGEWVLPDSKLQAAVGAAGGKAPDVYVTVQYGVRELIGQIADFQRNGGAVPWVKVT